MVIEMTGITRKYGDFTAVKPLDLQIRKGEIFGLLGPNGAGKSTVILMMLGLTEPTEGTVRVFGMDPARHPIEIKKRVGYLPEDVGFYDNLTGMENLLYTARLNGLDEHTAHQKAEDLLDQVGLQHAKTKKTGKYSRGMRQRLGLADVLIKNPGIIILDEPTSGIDPKGVKEFLEMIVNLSKARGITVLFSSHNLHQVQQVCDRMGLFVKGEMLAMGTLQALTQQLFGETPWVVEVRLSPGKLPEETFSTTGLTKILKPVEGIRNITEKNGTFFISSSRDTSAEIARSVISAGAELHYLNLKRYGLDDIYYRYFEGGKKDA